jgi:hypothetical protein
VGQRLGAAPRARGGADVGQPRDWSEADVGAALQANKPEVARGGGGTPIPLGGAFGARFGTVVQEPAGFVRKAQVGTWRDDLSPVERLLVWRVASGTMAEVGYSWPRPWR